MTFDRDWLVHRYETLTSTMDRAALLAQFGACDRTAVLSNAQTAGRGRGIRTWHSPPGSAVYCTLILRPQVAPDRLSVLSLVAGAAVAEAIEGITGARVQLKWPNDVWLGNDPEHQKVAGVLLTSKLLEQAVDHVLIGIGINVSASLDELPPGATSLAACGTRTAPDAVFRALLEQFDVAYAAYLEAEGRPSLEGWRARAALLNEQVAVEDRGRVREGTYIGNDDDGALLLHDPNGPILRIVAGDLVRGPQALQRR